MVNVGATNKMSRIIKIFHGPVSVAGIGWNLAEGQRKRGYKSDCIVYDDDGQHQLYHRNLNFNKRGRLERIWLRFKLLTESLMAYNIFHFYSGQTLLPYHIDLPILRMFGKKILMTYCGSDIRLYEILLRSNPYIALINDGLNTRKYDRSKKIRMRWQGLFIHRFTAPRNLYEHATAIIPARKVVDRPWLNNIGFNSEKSPSLIDIKTSHFPRVIHAPSNPLLKGSVYVTKAVQELRARGLKFEFTELTFTPNQRVHEVIKESDIVLDQFILGGIGTLAFEGMGYGKPVISYIPENLLNKYMPDCPIHIATIENLTERLGELINDAEKRIELGRRGVEFVCRHLNYNKIQNEVINLYCEL